jgi:hypothetical protein
MKRVNPALAVVAAAFLGARMLGPGQEVGEVYRITDGVSRSHVEYHQLTLARGRERVLAELLGPGKVTYFYITDDTQVHWYPGLVLRVFWDEEAEPSVEAPLADFFGAVGGKTIDYQSAPMQINHGCYMCYLPMPFSRRARFILANDGERDYAQSVAYGIDYEQDKRYASEKSRLHCAWQRSNPVKQGLHTVLEARGRGQYLGNFLQVHTRFAGWWGEGDTIFELDGQRMTHSPGTEDEYGSCWGFEHTYSYLYSGYLQMERGDHRMYRWYLANPVRFQKSLRVEIQNQHQNGRPTTTDADDYTSVAFWYQEGPHHRPGLAPFAERVAPTQAGR